MGDQTGGKIFILLLAALTIWVPAAHSARLANDVTGRWVKIGGSQTECICGECIEIQPIPVDAFCVESNQIYIKAHYKMQGTKNLSLYFKDIAEVGLGGAALPWDRFDRNKPLADIDLSQLDEGVIRVKWVGFREKRRPSKKYPFGDGYSGVYQKSWTLKKPSTEEE